MRKTTYSLTNGVRFFPLGALVYLSLFVATAGATLSIVRPAGMRSRPTVRISPVRPLWSRPGVCSLRNGVTWSTEQRSNVVDGPQTLVGLGVAPCMEIFFSVPDYIYAIGGTAPTGFSDLVASAKLELPRRLIGFRIAAIAVLSFPAGGSRISSHGYDPLLQLPWKHPIGEHWAVEGMFAITWLTTEPTIIQPSNRPLRSSAKLPPGPMSSSNTQQTVRAMRVPPISLTAPHFGVSPQDSYFLASGILSISTAFLTRVGPRLVKTVFWLKLTHCDLPNNLVGGTGSDELKQATPNLRIWMADRNS
jgi:hypothetical protein